MKAQIPTTPSNGTSQTIKHCATFWKDENTGHFITSAETRIFATAMAPITASEMMESELNLLPNVLANRRAADRRSVRVERPERK